MRKHHEHPTHRVHGKRLNPAARLLKLAEKNIGPYGEEWEGLGIGPILELVRETIQKLEVESFSKNPGGRPRDRGFSFQNPGRAASARPA